MFISTRYFFLRVIYFEVSDGGYMTDADCGLCVEQNERFLLLLEMLHEILRHMLLSPLPETLHSET